MINQQYIGHLKGLKLELDFKTDALDADIKSLKKAARQNVSPEIIKRISQIIETGLIELKDNFEIHWKNYPIAKLIPGSDYLNPQIHLIIDEMIENNERNNLNDYLNEWIIKKIETEQKLNEDDETVLLLKKAICLFHLGDSDSAHEIATDLLRQNPKFKDALDVVALTSIKLGKRKLGLRAIEKAEKLASHEDKQNEELPVTRIPRKAERALSETKNVVIKPTFRYNPDKKTADAGIVKTAINAVCALFNSCLLYTSPSPRDGLLSRMPSSA